MDFQGNAQRLVEGHDPSWSPDGSRLAYVGKDGGLWLINADGTGAEKLGDTGRELTWSKG